MLESFVRGFIEGFMNTGCNAIGAAVRWVVGGCKKKYLDLFEEESAANILLGLGTIALVIVGLLLLLL